MPERAGRSDRAGPGQRPGRSRRRPACSQDRRSERDDRQHTRLGPKRSSPVQCYCVFSHPCRFASDQPTPGRHVGTLVHPSRLNNWSVTIADSEAGLTVAALPGEPKAAELFQLVGGLGETAKELAYRLYVICERKKWASEALAYNALVVAWPEISRLAAGESPSVPAQPELL